MAHCSSSLRSRAPMRKSPGPRRAALRDRRRTRGVRRDSCAERSLGRMWSRELTVVDGPPGDGRALYIHVVDDDEAGYRLVQRGDVLHLEAGNDVSLQYAFFDLLETMGARFFHPEDRIRRGAGARRRRSRPPRDGRRGRGLARVSLPARGLWERQEQQAAGLLDNGAPPGVFDEGFLRCQ